MGDLQDTKEGLNMGTINKPQEAIVVTKGMTKAFLDLLASKKVSKAYWDECSRTNKNLSAEDIIELKRMCNEDK